MNISFLAHILDQHNLAVLHREFKGALEARVVHLDGNDACIGILSADPIPSDLLRVDYETIALGLFQDQAVVCAVGVRW